MALRDRPTSEVTQEMIDAGSDELAGHVVDHLWAGWLTRDEVAERVIRAALKVRSASSPESRPGVRILV